MATLEGKHFSITDPKDVSTIIYKVNKQNIFYREGVLWKF